MLKFEFKLKLEQKFSQTALSLTVCLPSILTPVIPVQHLCSATPLGTLQGMRLGHLLRRLNNQYSVDLRCVMHWCERPPCQLVSLNAISKWEKPPVNLERLKV